MKYYRKHIHLTDQDLIKRFEQLQLQIGEGPSGVLKMLLIHFMTDGPGIDYSTLQRREPEGKFIILFKYSKQMMRVQDITDEYEFLVKREDLPEDIRDQPFAHIDQGTYDKLLKGGLEYVIS